MEVEQVKLLIGVVVTVMFLDALLLYCMLCVGAREDRWMERHRLLDCNGKEERKEQIIDGEAKEI
jgi:hypothetical protein